MADVPAYVPPNFTTADMPRSGTISNSSASPFVIPPALFGAQITADINQGSESGFYIPIGVAPPPPPDPPAVSGFNPALASAISSVQPITFSVTALNGLLRAIVAVSFPHIGIYEIIHDGDAFNAEAYPDELGNVRTPITGGFTFTVLRKEGWPASPHIVPMAFDAYGQLNPITSVTYAWTLV